MKKAIALLLALVMVFALCACGGGDKSTADNGEKVVKIGVFEPASGDSGAGGKKEMLVMQYANQETPTVEIGGETYNVTASVPDGGLHPGVNLVTYSCMNSMGLTGTTTLYVIVE